MSICNYGICARLNDEWRSLAVVYCKNDDAEWNAERRCEVPVGCSMFGGAVGYREFAE